MEQPQQQQAQQPAPPPQVAPQAAAAAAVPPTFVQDPAAYLGTLALQPPSRQALTQLAGPVAAWFSAQPVAAAAVASVYLQAAAVQLRENNQVGDAEQEMIRTQQQYEVLEAVGLCASLCKSRRMSISSSGILPTLVHITLSQPNQLQQAGVEFLQCALLAEQYRYAARIVAGSWPRPNATVSVQMVLRYYYLRGMIHLGGDDHSMAHRCFWTCLSIPAEINSKIMMEAWKKLVLVQCLMSDGTKTATTLPKSVPNCLGRLLSSYKEVCAVPPNKASSSKRGQQQQQQQQALARPVICYMDISEAFYKRDKVKLEALRQEHQQSLTSDGNLGLVNQCHTELIHHQVKHLSRMYSVVPIAKAAEQLLVDPSEIPTLLCQSQVPCELQDDGMVAFGEADASPSSSLVDITEWMHLLDKVQRLDVSISTSAKYHSLVRKDSNDSKQVAVGPRGVDDF